MSNIVTDCAFAIGTTHHVCEDYARCSDEAVVLCDGCSSSKDTDIGARLLATTTLSLSNFIPTYPTLSVEFFCHVVQIASTIEIQLEVGAIDATVLVARVFENELAVPVLGAPVVVPAIQTGTMGDGFIVARYCDENVFRIFKISYPDEYPLYPSIYANNERHRAYANAGHGKSELITCQLANGEYSREENLREGWYDFGDMGVFQHTFNAPEFDLVLLFSDGLDHFYELIETDTSRSRQDVPWQDVLKLFLDIKNTTPGFLKRRFNKFLKDCKKRNWFNADDISVAGIYVGDDDGSD